MPSRLPREVKARRGTLRAGRENPNAPAPLELAKVGPPPRGTPPHKARVWRRLAEAVQALKLYDASLYVSFALLVEAVALPLDPDATPAVRQRALATAGTAMARWGLSPSDRERAAKAPDPNEEASKTRHGRWAVRVQR